MKISCGMLKKSTSFNVNILIVKTQTIASLIAFFFWMTYYMKENFLLRNVVFDETSSWWSPQVDLLSKSKEIEEKFQERIKGNDMLDNRHPNEEEQPIVEYQKARLESSKKSKSPQQTRIPPRVMEELESSQLEEQEEQVPQLRRTARLHKPNPNYVNATFVKVGALELIDLTFMNVILY